MYEDEEIERRREQMERDLNVQMTIAVTFLLAVVASFTANAYFLWQWAMGAL